MISVKLNIGRKIIGSEILTLNFKKIDIDNIIDSYRKSYKINLRRYRTHVKGELHCLQGCFRKLNGREEV